MDGRNERRRKENIKKRRKPLKNFKKEKLPSASSYPTRPLSPIGTQPRKEGRLAL